MELWLEKQQMDLDSILEQYPEQYRTLLPDQVLMIFKSPARTRMLAQLFRVKPSVISQIKGQRGEYRQIIWEYKRKVARALMAMENHYEKFIQY